jgi:uncharacterized membrane protein (DUF4010 family)
MQPWIAWELLVALALGLVIGLERGWERREAEPGRRVAGLRTFGLVSLLGGISARLARDLSPDFLPFAFAGVALLATAGYFAMSRRGEDLGATTEVALLVAFVLGALVVVGYASEAAAAAVVVAVLLRAKGALHGWIERLERYELDATLQLLLIAVVVLPLLPDLGLGPWQALNPRAIGLLVLLIAGLSFVSYFAVKLVDARAGLLLTAILGGLTSSTAVTLTFARMGREARSLAPWLAAGIGLAAAMMALRLGVMLTVVRPALLPAVAPALAALAIVPALAVLSVARGAPPPATAELGLRNPLEIGMAARYGVLLAVLMLVVRGVQAGIGDAGVLGVAVLSGLFDVDAVTLSLAQLSGGELALDLAARGIVVAALANTASKALLAAAIGGRALAFPVAAILGTTFAAAVVAAVLSFRG